MMTNPGHAAIVRSVVDLGHNLTLRVVAEGVETEDVHTELRRVGCDMAQGSFSPDL
jgi:EAL domain-containing protein (putative c-di-GMP-specific phosphodiesterase class I)